MYSASYYLSVSYTLGALTILAKAPQDGCGKVKMLAQSYNNAGNHVGRPGRKSA